MSEVYLGRREADGVAVALKLLDTRLGAASHLLDRFIQECEMLESIRHPNVARMYGHGFTDSHAFISMEYFECGDIRQRMNSGMTPFQALSVTYQVALALKQVHVLGIVHRDVKPENLKHFCEDLFLQRIAVSPENYLQKNCKPVLYFLGEHNIQDLPAEVL